MSVAASSAFPPLFSPVVIETDPASWSGGEPGSARSAMRRRLVLSDGGVYDNMGLEVLQQGKVDYALVSDAGAPFELQSRPATGPLQMARVRDILIDQTRALRKRMLIGDFATRRQRGAYWGIDTLIGSYKDAHALGKDSAETAALAKVPTRLAALIAAVGPCPLRAGGAGGAGPAGADKYADDHFAGLVQAIASQQLSSKAAETIYGRVKQVGLDDVRAARDVDQIAAARHRCAPDPERR